MSTDLSSDESEERQGIGHDGLSRRRTLLAGVYAASAAAMTVTLRPAGAQSADPSGPAAAAAAAAALQFSYVAGAGGVPLSVARAGLATGPGILFIHGLGQSHLSFSLQLQSSLAQDHQLVAFDLRGHGNSGKPWDGAAYSDSRTWADDVARVLDATGLRRPIVVAWSFGTLVIADYVRHHGTQDLSGIMMIGALGGLAALPPRAADPALTAKLQELHALSASPGLENTLLASRKVVPLLTARPMPPAWSAIAETANTLVPPFARGALTARIAINNQDLIGRLQVPMSLVAGSEDKNAPSTLLQGLAAELSPHAETRVYQGCGHSPFAEDPEHFNQDLRAFAMRVPA